MVHDYFQILKEKVENRRFYSVNELGLYNRKHH